MNPAARHSVRLRLTQPAASRHKRSDICDVIEGTANLQALLVMRVLAAPNSTCVLLMADHMDIWATLPLIWRWQKESNGDGGGCFLPRLPLSLIILALSIVAWRQKTTQI